MISSDSPPLRPSAPKERRRRALWLYWILGLSSLIFGASLLWALRSLILPLVFGMLLAYLFRPLVNNFNLPWLGEAFRAPVILILIFSGLIFLGLQVRNSIPDESGKLELMVRLHYKVNEKYESLMQIDPTTGKGNFLHGLFERELTPFLTSMNQLLSLDAKQQKAFLEHLRQDSMSAARAQVYLRYFEANLARSQSQSPFRYPLSEPTAPPHSPQPLAESGGERQPSSYHSAALVTPGDGRSSALAWILQTLSIWVLVPLIFVFMLLDRGNMVRRLISLAPNRYFELSYSIVDEVDKAIGQYLRGTFLQCSLVGLTLTIGFAAAGIQLKVALLMGVVAGMANAIPFLGPFIGLVVGLSYALIAENISPWIPGLSENHIFLAVMAVVALAQFLDNVLFQPVILGGAVSLHPIVVILGVIGGSILFGFAGMLLAIPSIVVAKVMLLTFVRGLIDYRLI